MREVVAQVLRKSLEVAPNADLRKFVSEDTQREAKPSLVQSWEEVATALKQGEFDKVLAFLNVEDRLRLDLSRASEIDSLFALIGDLLTMPGLDQVKGARFERHHRFGINGRLHPGPRFPECRSEKSLRNAFRLLGLSAKEVRCSLK